VRVGVVIIPTDPWPVAVARARAVEAFGYDHLWTYDHLSWRRYREEPWHAAIPWLTGVAAATERIRLGTMVTSPNFRHPVTLAKDAMTLDHVSGGRLVLGVGAGGIGFDATVLGGTVLTPGVRAARLVEFVDTLDGLLRQPAYSHSGEFYTVHEARMVPGCVQIPRVPLALAAAGTKTLALAARQGDAWITFGDPGAEDCSPAALDAVLRRQAAVLDRECERIGRDPATIDRVFLAGDAVERPLRSVEAFRELVQRIAALGFTDLVVHDPRPGDPVWDGDPAILEAIAREVLPELATEPRPHGTVAGAHQ